MVTHYLFYFHTVYNYLLIQYILGGLNFEVKNFCSVKNFGPPMYYMKIFKFLILDNAIIIE